MLSCLFLSLSPNIAIFCVLGRVWFQQKAVKIHHIQLKNDLMLVTWKEPMLATLFKFVMSGLGWKVWDSLLEVEQFSQDRGFDSGVSFEGICWQVVCSSIGVPSK